MNDRFLAPALAFEQVSHRYGDHAALDDVSFQCAPGEFIALLGASGSGKTTLLRGAAGLLAFDRGVVRSPGSGDRRTIAMVFQSHVLIDRLSALDNVLAGRLGYNPRWRGWLRRFTRDDRLLAADCLDRVGLLSHAARRVDAMSGGERQRIALARALAQQPAVLLADEPVASLDPEAGASVLRLLRECCRDRQATVVCSLHQPALALEHADRVVALRSGRVVLDAPADTLDAAALAAVYR
ncbi:MAG: ATP-binding cassette domain-containing protein [Burkholderiales bacterium]|jgi:phosphonate transport system ATP-binding protein|nr:ATP-binding cassette domain-containing protein [Burkholderiales bacterium]